MTINFVSRKFPFTPPPLFSCDYDDSGDEDEKAKQDEQMVSMFNS